ncbi:MAG TPA: hypothetical protein VEL76_34905, partial [Gemmataceae bacterium]|nr:hypothetical protein [Gemmataceae bacterium]
KRSGSCVIWDLTTQQRVAEFGVPGSATAAAPLGLLSPDGTRLALVTAAANPKGGQVLMVVGYDVTTGKKLAEVLVPDKSGTVTVGVADNTSAVVRSNSGRVWTVDYANGRVGEDIDNVPVRGEMPFTGRIVFSPDGKRFAMGVVGEPFKTYGVRVYDLAQRKALHTFLGHAGMVTALRFTPDGHFLASGAEDSSVLLWDLTRLPSGK